jgi:hypothetical protein
MAPDRKNMRWILGLIALGALSRLIPHPHNFTPIAALGLFAAAYIRPVKLAWLAPFLALWISDLLIMNTLYADLYGEFRWFGHPFVFAGFFLIFLLGTFLKKITALRLGAFSLTSSAVFFLVSNFGVWLGSAVYPQNISGLLACYTAGLPFFGNTIAGDLVYVSLLFGAYHWVAAREKTSIAG